MSRHWALGTGHLLEQLAVDLARPRQRKLVHHLETLGPLVARHAKRRQVFAEFVERHLADHERYRPLTEVMIRATHHARIRNTRMQSDSVFDLVRVDVAAAPDDDVLQAPDDLQVTVVIEPAEIAHVGPAIIREWSVLLAPVPLLDGRSAHANLT